MWESEGGASASRGLTGWLEWAGRHPGVILLGSLVLAALLTASQPRQARREADAGAEEVPLFI